MSSMMNTDIVVLGAWMGEVVYLDKTTREVFWMGDFPVRVSINHPYLQGTGVLEAAERVLSDEAKLASG